MDIAKAYLVIFDLARPKPEHAKLAADLDRYSVQKPFLLFVASQRIGYLIRTPLLPSEMTFDGHLLNGDSVLLLELTGRCAVEGYTLRDAAEWLRRG